MEDWWEIVFKFLQSPGDYLELGLTCKSSLQKLQRFESRLKDCRHLERLLKYFPDKEWDWNAISCNETLSWRFIKKNFDKPWVWYYLSWNPSIKWEDIMENRDLVWSSKETPHRTTLCWEWEYISWNPSLKWEYVRDNIN